ncbi:RNA polymerase sigma factor [bacterium]|nr:RNA polymerase sigma factor [bacterium]
MPSREPELESSLLRRARDGDREAFAALVLRHRREALQVALGFVGDLEDARDLTQEAFLRALSHMHRFDVERPFFPWFYRILRNLCFNFLAKRGRHGECPLVLERDGGIDPAGAGVSPLQSLEASERGERIWQALCTLSPEHREIILLRHFRDLSYQEIAGFLHIPRGTVMSRLFYARAALREALESRLGKEGPTLAEATEAS